MDQILVSILSNRLKAIGRQMGVVIERSAHSPLLVEGRDFSLGIYDFQGNLIEQTEYIPILGYAASPGVKEVVKYFGEDVYEGDVFLHNDPFTGGNQNSDWKVLKPVFHNGECVAWTVITAHQADVGGAVPGSYNPNATDLWQEGLRITPLKIYEKGKLRYDVWDLVIGNVRLPIVGDDIHAMVGGCTVGERELKVLFEQYSKEVIYEAVEEIFNSTEKMAKKIIKGMPNGNYKASWKVRDDGHDHDAEMTIKVDIQVDDEHITFDFEGTSPQTKGYVNAPYPVTLSSVMITFFMLSEQEIAHNEAVQRCITLKVPEGTMLNPNYPAATGFGNHLSDQVCSVIMLALEEALPERVTAGWNTLLCAIVNGSDSRRQMPYVDILLNGTKGGSGGTYGTDGYDHIGLIASGGALAAQDPEMFEMVNPVFLTKYEYSQDSAGAGQWRGGLGVETTFTFLDDKGQASIFGDGATEDTRAPGILGGEQGSINTIELHYPNNETYVTHVKDLISDIPKNTVYKQLAGGGGGYGNPADRAVEKVAFDVRCGYVSEQVALEQYKVAFKDAGRGIVDTDQTEKLRQTV
ncbi:hydantoinase B/oxoprolinase family protein [Planococcus shenhongbingii]|uniref:Hydantoinase B/oxoprolinase family protein n=1 Tax=Planococcus shenhongbingii TaxID=3058398 RepID=A0ABT8NBF6_9BACL|nr:MULTISPECIES: hydantoinase B/oxoprolinase family protein [unclassified Planococcus (in: firmicutes)]MDN7245206.1 hydantoinase B/oxoprolinase family protein [Planococcus sp. N017]WKA58307.1 hydantoinase B/oxoprolinase family protein [Planococcus sp. N016]